MDMDCRPTMDLVYRPRLWTRRRVELCRYVYMHHVRLNKFQWDRAMAENGQKYR